MDFQQIRDFVNPAVAQATGLQEVENLAMPVPVAYVPVQLVIDGALSLTSENPVQNKVIAVAIQNLDGRITAVEGQFAEGVTEAVNNWLAAHPEATTTVQDGAITYAKLDTNLKAEVDQISDLESALTGMEFKAYGQQKVNPTWQRGAFEANGYTALSSMRYVCTEKIPAGHYTVKVPTGYYSEVYKYNSNNSGTAIYTMNGNDKDFTSDTEFIISSRKNPSADITADELASLNNVIEIQRILNPDGGDIPTLKTDVSTLKSDMTQAVKGRYAFVNASNYETVLPSFDNADTNTIYGIDGCLQLIQGVPSDVAVNSATLLTYSARQYGNKSWYVQCLTVFGGDTYTRSCWAGNWTEFKKFLIVSDKGYNDGINLNANYFVGTCVDKTKTRITASDTIIAFGDSITHGSTANGVWVDEFCAIVGCSAINAAISGALFSHAVDAKPSAYWISTQISGITNEQWANCKLVVIAAGTNDVGYNADLTEVKTQIESIITTVKAATNAHILFITPIRTASSYNSKLPKLSGIIVNAALKNGCSVVEGFTFPIATSDIDSLISNLTADGLHPNQTGSKVFAKSVINAIF